MKKLIIICMCLGIGFFTFAQNFINYGASIKVSSGSSIVIDGDFRNALDGSIDNSGDIFLTGDFTNNQTSGTLLSGTSGAVIFNGSSVQTIAGTAVTYFNDIDLQNDANLAAGAMAVYGDLTLSSTYFGLGGGVLVMQPGTQIIGANASGYIVTNGLGFLRQYVGGSNKVFPVGTTTTFAPVMMNNSGTPDYYSARVFEDVRTNGLSGATIPEIDDCVNMTWDINEFNAGGSNLSVTPFWGAAMEGSSFDRTACAVGHYTGGAWDPDFEGVASGSNPYSITRSGITTLSAFAVGDLESPMAILLDLRIDLTAFLEGPFNGADMDNTLNSAGVIPLNQPYNTAPINYFGSESVPAIPNANIIDWVLVELRDATSAANATSGTIVEQMALFLRNDGAIVDLDGSSMPGFTSTINNNLYVVVRHRNHVAIMSANAVTETGGIYSYNFTDAVGKVYGGAAGHKQIAAGTWGLFSANGYPDQFIIIHDRDFVWAPESGSTGYLNGDFDMNTQVNNVDKNDHWVENTGENSQVPN